MGALAQPAAESLPRVFGRYVLLENLGRGGMGEVFLAKTTAAGGFEKVCAVKKIRGDLSADGEFAARFRDEARVVVRLNHGNIAQIYDAGQLGDEYYLAMEYVEGQSLLKIILRAREIGRLIPPDIALYVVHELCSGLGYAHRRADYDARHLGLVHRDVNPQNVLVSYDGEVKLIDFGLAASSLKSVATRVGVAMGKAHYMAPEQARGKDVDARTDVYAAGIVLWELLTAQRCLDIPKDGGPAEVARAIISPKIDAPSVRIPTLSADIDAIVAKALTPKPDERYDNAEAFRRAIAEKLYRLNPAIGPDVLAEYLHGLFHEEILRQHKSIAELLAQDVSRLVQQAESEGRRTVTFVKPGGDTTAAGEAPPAPALIEAADVSIDLAPGTVLAGRYEIQSPLGQGGMGTVYAARHLDIGRRVAVKILHPGLAQNAEVLARFRREARAASMIGHPNIVMVTDFGQTRGGRSFFVMEYLDGRSLAEVIRQEAPLAGRRAARVLRQVTNALHAAHEAGIIHRDLKPDNVYLVAGEGGAEIVKILDFGIAKVTGRDESMSDLTQSGLVFGTPQYMSPEQAAGQGLDRRADVYSAGILMYECLTKQLPFTGATVGQVLAKQLAEAPMPPRRRAPEADIPEPLEHITLKMLAKDPGGRYQTAAEVDEDLRRFLAGNPVLAAEDGARKRGAMMPPPPPRSGPSQAVRAVPSSAHAFAPTPAAGERFGGGAGGGAAGTAPGAGSTAAPAFSPAAAPGRARRSGTAPPPTPGGANAVPSGAPSPGGSPSAAASSAHVAPSGGSSPSRPVIAVSSEAISVVPVSQGHLQAITRRSRLFLAAAVLGTMVGAAAIVVAIVIYLNPPPRADAPIVVVPSGESSTKREGKRSDPERAVDPFGVGDDVDDVDAVDAVDDVGGRAADTGDKMPATDPSSKTARSAAPATAAPIVAADLVTLTFRSRPSGARIMAGSENKGLTPLKLAVPRGTYPIAFVVVAEGYEPYALSVVPNKDRPVNTKLKAKKRATKGRAPKHRPPASASPFSLETRPETSAPETSAPRTSAGGLKDPY